MNPGYGIMVTGGFPLPKLYRLYQCTAFRRPLDDLLQDFVREGFRGEIAAAVIGRDRERRNSLLFHASTPLRANSMKALRSSESSPALLPVRAGLDQGTDFAGAGNVINQKLALQAKAVRCLDRFRPHADRIVLIMAEEHGERQIDVGESALLDHVADAIRRIEASGRNLHRRVRADSRAGQRRSGSSEDFEDGRFR